MKPAASDPVIDEIREIRHRILERCGHDPARLVVYYMELQKQFQDRLIDGAKPGSRIRRLANGTTSTIPDSLADLQSPISCPRTCGVTGTRSASVPGSRPM